MQETASKGLNCADKAESHDPNERGLKSRLKSFIECRINHQPIGIVPKRSQVQKARRQTSQCPIK